MQGEVVWGFNIMSQTKGTTNVSLLLMAPYTLL